MPEFDQQSEEIKRICAAAGLTPEEMAARVGIKADSMRKVYNGYQPASAPLMQSIVNAAELERLRRVAGAPLVLQEGPSHHADLHPENVITFRTQDAKAAECITYVADYLNRNQRDADRVRWFLVELKERFPMPPVFSEGSNSRMSPPDRRGKPGAGVGKASAGTQEHPPSYRADAPTGDKSRP